jgi:hypothetical protein
MVFAHNALLVHFLLKATGFAALVRQDIGPLQAQMFAFRALLVKGPTPMKIMVLLQQAA